ncbi:unnamed protein product [Medioppia subpectinata]|uniref:Uncharacterized protein n=1 Tax=Medioppia subpectinata TaxID=1979941 RepID=A0A7R9KLG3_9ACAR|nr:unnamed protein product [Medioppia subpectinata]CAG2104553.1 unnamed protein product [Medioppia subpectinata]
MANNLNNETLNRKPKQIGREWPYLKANKFYPIYPNIEETCHSIWSQFSTNIFDEPDSQHSLTPALTRSTDSYLDPSSPIEMMPSSDVSIVSFSRDFIGLSSEISGVSESVITSDALTERFTTKEYILSSTFQTKSNSYSTLGIESSFTIPETQTLSPIETIPIYPMEYTTVSLITTPTITTTTVTLCPEPLGHQNLRQPPDKPYENYLVRTVLNNTNHESIDSIKARIEANITQIYNYAFGLQYKQTDRMAANASTKLLSKLNYTNITVKDINHKKGLTEIQVVYYVEKNGILLPYEDIERALSFIPDKKYSEMIAYNVVKAAKLELNLIALILISCSAIIIIMCVIMGGFLFCKYRSERRKWMDAFNSQLNRVSPDNQIHWRTVSQPMDPKSTASDTQIKDKNTDKSNEFQYLRFESNTSKASLISKGTQSESSLQMEKQKVIPIPIGKLIDRSTDSTDATDRKASNEYTATTYVTTREIETDSSEENRIPHIITVQMSSQTESIIRAIRSELNKFGHNSSDNAFPYIDDSHDTYTEESIISNSSEA